MTFRQAMLLELDIRGVEPWIADRIMARIEQGRTALRKLLDQSAEGQPSFRSYAWAIVRSTAVEWIDENRPQAWYRGLIAV